MPSLTFKRWLFTILGVLAVITSIFVIVHQRRLGQTRTKSWKLYWFVPDGLRADPDVFRVFQWAQEGKLPNIKRMMDEGSYGYSIPVFPSHTPINFASLFTGVKPLRHGVADGPMRTSGYPLNIVTRSGFSSIAKTIDPFWYTLEQAGWIVSLLSIPGSTPPEIIRGSVVKGRWGGWGIEFPSMMFHAQADRPFREILGWNDKVFQIEKKLTEFVDARDPSGWQLKLPESFSPLREITLRNWDKEIYILLGDSRDDRQEAYDRAYVSLDKKSFLFSVDEGKWSEWFDLDLSYRVQRNYQENLPQRLKVEQEFSKLSFKTPSRIKIVKLGKKDFFRIRVIYDGLNESVVVPQSLNPELHEAAGPMVDFVDNFPPQLIYFPEDKATFQEESEMSFEWHRRAENYFLHKVNQDVFVQSIYSSNQMLTSRWWMGALDPKSRHYQEISESDRAQLWSEVLAMYKHVDDMIGDALKTKPPDAYVVLSSDHGVVPLNWEVRLNNFFAKKGWLHYVEDQNGIPRVDWSNTKVVFLNMAHVFIHPNGLAGNYQPSKGEAFEKLRDEVLKALTELADESGRHPLAAAQKREDAVKWGLPGERVGDLVIANAAGYGWIEDVTKDLKVFASSLKSGYKQAVLPDQERGLWTPFLIVGPGIKRGHQLSRPISIVEQYPTVMKALKVAPTFVPDGKPLDEIFDSM